MDNKFWRCKLHRWNQPIGTRRICVFDRLHRQHRYSSLHRADADSSRVLCFNQLDASRCDLPAVRQSTSYSPPHDDDDDKSGNTKRLYLTFSSRLMLDQCITQLPRSPLSSSSSFTKKNKSTTSISCADKVKVQRGRRRRRLPNKHKKKRKSLDEDDATSIRSRRFMHFSIKSSTTFVSFIHSSSKGPLVHEFL